MTSQSKDRTTSEVEEVVALKPQYEKKVELLKKPPPKYEQLPIKTFQL